MGIVSVEHQVQNCRGRSRATMARVTKLRLIWVKHDQRFAVTRFSDDRLQMLQREIQRLMGRCLLLLQSYERLMKVVVKQHDILAPAQSLDKTQASRADDISRKTLGNLVNQLLETFLTTDEKARTADESHKPLETGPQVTIRMQLRLSADDFSRIESGLRELVLLRNNLVHHFLDQHDLGNLDGCRAAEEALIAASGQIKQRFDDLRHWAEDLERMRLRAAEVIRSGAFHDLLVHGAMPWPITAIVIALREAALELTLDGWAPVERAGEWVSARYPAELPANYGCRSWRQVIHESGVFELRYRQTDGQGAAWYRAKSRGLNLE